MSSYTTEVALHLAAIVDSSQDAIISKDLTGRVTSWNRAAERLFGYGSAEIIGQSIRRIIPDERQPEADEVLRRIQRGERVEHFETVRRAKDGTAIPVSLTVSPIYDATGAVVGAAKIARDLRDQQKAPRARTFADRVANTSPDLLFVYDIVEGRDVFVNARVLDLFGYHPEEFLSTTSNLAQRIVPAEDLPNVAEVFRRFDTASDDDVVEYEHRLIRADGAVRNVRVRASVFERTPDGRAKQIVGHCVDITEAKAAHARQLELQDKLHALVAASTTALTVPQLDSVVPAAIATARQFVLADGYALWRIDQANDAWVLASSYGVSPEFARDVISQGDTRPSVARDRLSAPLVIDDIAGFASLGDRRAVYEREGIRSLLAVPLTAGDEPTGSLVFYYRHSTRMNRDDVQVATALGNFVASALRVAELYEELQQRERTSAFLAEAGRILASSLEYHDTLRRLAQLAVPEIADWCAVDVLGDDGEPRRLAVAHVDPAKVELVRAIEARYPANRMSRYGVYEVVRSKAPVMLPSIPEDLLLATARDCEHLRLIRDLGVCSYMCVPLLAHHRVLGVVTFATAESKRHYRESDLRFAEQLATRAALAIENAHAFESVRRANMLKDEFLATLSHELRTPLNAVLGYTRMLRLRQFDETRQQRALETVERNATSLTQLVEDILDVSRIMAGKIRLQVTAVDVPKVVREAVASIQPAADAKGIGVQAMLSEPVEPIAGDPERLQQVVWNLVSNAVKFTTRGGRVHLTVTTIDSHVEIQVSDTGIGISEAFLPHVFDRFRQADNRFSREHGGLGLGLAISRQIVELHGGTIDVTSAGEGKGATFRVRLPLMAAHRDHDSESGPRERRARSIRNLPGLPRLDHVRVVAVDDDADALSLVAEILEEAGAEVKTARSAADALAQLQASPADVLVADIGMPDMDGFELIRLVRASGRPEVSDIPSAALTAYARSEDRTHALAAGFQMHLAKPIDPRELIVAVGRLAQQKPARRVD